MHTLRIEHPIRDFDSWKAAFDSDPAGREKSGVRRYRILRPTDDLNTENSRHFLLHLPRRIRRCMGIGGYRALAYGGHDCFGFRCGFYLRKIGFLASKLPNVCPDDKLDIVNAGPSERVT